MGDDSGDESRPEGPLGPIEYVKLRTAPTASAEAATRWLVRSHIYNVGEDRTLLISLETKGFEVGRACGRNYLGSKAHGDKLAGWRTFMDEEFDRWVMVQGAVIDDVELARKAWQRGFENGWNRGFYQMEEVIE